MTVHSHTHTSTSFSNEWGVIARSERTLDNGLRLVGVQRAVACTALVAVDARVGARYEAPGDGGLSHFLEHMVFQGCAGFPTPDAVNLAAEQMGSALDASTSRSTTHIEHLIEPSRLGESANLIASILAEPLFLEIENERAIVLEEALDEVDEDGRCVDADTISRRLLWPGSALGEPVIGERAHIKRFSESDLRRHHTQFYGARNLVATVVGPQAPEALLDAVSRAFERLPPGELRTPTPVGESSGGPWIECVSDTRSQVECRLVLRMPGAQDPDAPLFQLLRIALDDGLASRLQRRLGAELGLAYDLWAATERHTDTGAFEVGAAVSPGKVGALLTAAQQVLESLRDDPPRGAELERLRFRARWATRCAHETPEGLAAIYGSPLAEDLPASPEETLRRIEAADSDALAAAAARMLRPDCYVAVFVGPLDKATRREIKHRARINPS